ncbi:cytochrome ubiquinol oxidase subunit I [Polaromonas naphthalenivorans]|uniref:Cytochrome bd quinol oxidase subunit 1 apoprotein n=1 Tax=Polaromonas naphthalenivorans (strain CJ2) TaxID=365044 RepID=A1VJI7_POLNA|nr:cytochrome ubiquinol oxidase subunit I [Polaromonas naphthalenivorans]ABM35815.1 cytochrome bd quinol oxidase subunit 1 apoprotein [Polaromonas naphthalenivorans CJ2]
MDGLDAVLLARIQFAANMTFHILFPTISISLAWVLLFFKLRFVKTGQQHWMDAYQFWVKIFALTFALGVVSGITMSFQFGTNWPGFMQKVGNIAGPLLAYEVLTAFFLEATMLGVMLFGRARVSEKMHTIATLLVAGGTTLSAFWILALNSWMHTPTGFEMIDGKAHVTSWLEVIFNPSFPYRFTHMMLASGLTVAFLVAGVSSYRWLRGERGAEAMAGLKTGIYLAAFLIPLQILAGDFHGLNTMEHQPAKLAAMEGIWQTQKGVPAVLFALPDEKAKENRYEIAIPKLASLYLTHHLDGEVRGLNEFEGQHPPVAPVFWAFRIMVGMGLLMLAVSWSSVLQLAPWKKDPARSIRTWQARALVAMTFAGWIALIAGWYTTEIGRQPWLVSGVLTAADAASQVVAPKIAFTLSLYLLLYAALIVAYVSVVFYLARHKTQADKPSGSGMEDTPNPVTYPEQPTSQPGAAHA